ncbi:hypothetical protein DSO57_1028370 [Entomophthora muscae]|uniref:Uncharacterized protein n=1 Tax=Entomophthora muscae TaxID=34485 RepID=A0ACC2RSJ3_9FUNG|nr:hypothetical protein DSO57_1028370 [Entomophthora muscae]
MKLMLALGLVGLSTCCFRQTQHNQQKCQGFKAKPYITSQNSQFGALIEGTSVNPSGHMFAVNFNATKSTNQLGQIFPAQKLIFTDSRPKSYLNAIRFLNPTTAFAADAANHRILKLTVDPKTNLILNSKVFCSDPKMIQPNDIVVASTGYIFTSGMNYTTDTKSTDGDIWACSPNGEAKRLALRGRTNGIELSPKEDFLYVSESFNKKGAPVLQRVLKYKVDVKTGNILDPVTFVDFGKFDNSASIDIDGMRADIYGNLFIARAGKGEVKVFNAEAKNIATIAVSFPNPTNLEFGGPKGSKLFVVGRCKTPFAEGVEKGCVDSINLETQGAGFKRIQSATPARRIRKEKRTKRIRKATTPKYN